MIRLIAALGNPGNEYQDTRHNIGWRVLEYLSFYSDLSWKNKFSGEYAATNFHYEQIYFLKPFTYMNLSGNSIRKAMDFFDLEPDEILILHDELELPFGTFSYKDGGGLGGHNGLRSIVNVLSTRDFKRIRFGISKPSHGDITSYVLGKFNSDQKIFLEEFLQKGAGLIEACLSCPDLNIFEKEYRKVQLIEN